MIKGKKIKFWILVCIAVGAIGFGVLNWLDAGRGHSRGISAGGYEADSGNRMGASPNGIGQPGIIRISTRKDEVMRSSIAKKGKRYFDSNGVSTKLSKTYQNDTPLVEILFRKRDLDGKIKPLKLSSAYISCGRAGANYDMNGNGAVRMEIWNEVQPFTYNALLYGEEYKVQGFFQRLDDQPGLIKGVTANVRFRTPESLMAGDVYRVELLLVDMLWEQAEAERKQAEDEQRKRIEREEEIRIVVGEYPQGAAKGRLVAIYGGGTRNREFTDHRSHGQLTLKGPNKLGGELAIYIMDADGPLPVWAYISNLGRRDVNLRIRI